MSEFNLPALPADMNVSDNVSTDQPFTPRIQLIHSTSKIIKEWNNADGKRPEAGEFLLGPPGQKLIGRTLNAVSLMWRDHALQVKGNEVTLESFDCPKPGHPAKNQDQEIFNKIIASKRSGDKKVQNRVGKDVLFWLPDYGVYAIYFFANTATKEAGNCVIKVEGQPKFGRFCIFTSYETPPSSSGFQWWLPEIENEMIPDGTVLPPQDQVIKEIQAFVSPSPKGEGRTSEGVDGRPR